MLAITIFVLITGFKGNDGVVEKVGLVEGEDVNNEVRLAVLLPYNENFLFQKQKVAPAIEMAVEKINNSLNLLHGKKIVVRYADTRCDIAHGINQAFEFYMTGTVDVFIGPGCDYAVAPIARQIRYWNIPLVTAGALARDFSILKHTVFSLMTQTGPGFNSLSLYFAKLLTYYKWKKYKIVYEPDGQDNVMNRYCHLAADGLHYGITSFAEDVQGFYYKYEPMYDEWDPRTELGLNYSVVVLCASPDSVREIMLKAAELNFTNGEYVFFNIDLFSSKNESERPWYRKSDTDEKNAQAMRAYEALLTVTLRKPDSPEYHNFSEAVKKKAFEDYSNFTYGEEEVNSFVGAFHDAVLLYALALNDTLEAGYNVTDGAEITSRMWNRTFEGITGNVSIDENGDRNADYSLLDLNPDTGKFEVVANYYGNRKKYEPKAGKQIYWSEDREKLEPPPDTPKCGYDNSKCPVDEFPVYGIAIIVLGLLLLFVVLAAILVYRHFKLEAELAEMNWRIRWDDILFSTMAKSRNKMGSRLSLNRKMSIQSDISGDTMAVHLSDMGNKQMFTKTGYYKAALVAIKKVNTHSISITKPLLIEIKKIRDLQNDHIVRFIGACIDPPNQCIVTEYCQKGSLQDVLENDQLKLDWMFRYSLMQDIVRGMAYLHGSDFRSHGNLKSSNCVVDTRFVLKITDFGLHSLRGFRDEVDEEDTYAYYRRKLWTAPELLRLHNPPSCGTQKGDVYSFAILCQEIIYRYGPFYLETLDLSPKEIYQKVKNGQQPYFRPTLDDDECTEQLAQLVKRCWSEDPSERPDFTTLKVAIKKLNKEGDSGNILDNLLSRMEQYANNLEALVEERTADYLEQKKKAEDLLYNMLPRSVAGQLIRGEAVTAESFGAVTIYFSDICGFTAMSAASTPMQVIDLLNDLYTTFDAILEHLDVYKVETIGDAYMVVSGLPIRNGDIHAREIARMALRILDAVLSFKVRHRPNEQLKLRIGMHSGPVCAGVVGLKMPRYCLFGDTVNTASRMESNGLPLKIHVSPHTKQILDKFGCFDLQLRGAVDMKGKGSVTTYWLLGEKDCNQAVQPTDRESNI